jgi:hypothetical protein
LRTVLSFLTAAFVALVLTLFTMAGPEDTEEPTFWTAKETAGYLRVPPSTLRYWTSKGRGPRSYKFGQGRRYRPAEVRAWAESRAYEPPNEEGSPDPAVQRAVKAAKDDTSVKAPRDKPVRTVRGRATRSA